MTIDEAIKARVERFNRLFIDATGHSFEDDPKWCEEQNKKEREVWLPKFKAVLEKNGFKNEEEYVKQIRWEDKNGVFIRVGGIDEIDDLLREEPHRSSVYGYDEMIHQQVKEIINFMSKKYDSLLDGWNKVSDNNTKNCWDIVDALKEDGFKKWDDGHSGNSGSMCILLVSIFIKTPDLFPYSHGALCYLVGDEGYHDKRDDIPAEIIEKYKTNE